MSQRREGKPQKFGAMSRLWFAKSKPHFAGCFSGTLSRPLASLAPVSTHCYCCSVFGKGLSPSSAPLTPPTCGSHNRVEQFPQSSAKIHQEGQGPAKGPIHHKRSCFHFPGPRR